MKDNSANKALKQGKKNSEPSLEQEVIKALEEKNEKIKNGEQQSDVDKNAGKLGGFDEWSVSWP